MDGYEEFNKCFKRLIKMSKLLGVCVVLKNYKINIFTLYVLTFCVIFIILSLYTICAAWGDTIMLLKTLAAITNGSQVIKNNIIYIGNTLKL